MVTPPTPLTHVWYVSLVAQIIFPGVHGDDDGDGVDDEVDDDVDEVDDEVDEDFNFDVVAFPVVACVNFPVVDREVVTDDGGLEEVPFEEVLPLAVVDVEELDEDEDEEDADADENGWKREFWIETVL